MKFPNLKDAHPRLPIALILNYKKNTCKRKRKVVNQEEKPKKNREEKHNSRAQ